MTGINKMGLDKSPPLWRHAFENRENCVITQTREPAGITAFGLLSYLEGLHG